MRRIVLIAVVVAAVLPVLAVPELPEHNLFEWCQVAPVIVSGVSLGESGKHISFRVTRSFRGDPSGDDTILIDLKTTNRERDRMLHPKPLRLDVTTEYLILLEKVNPSRTNRKAHYRIARGVRGAKELPVEGVEAYLTALRRFIEIQDLGSDPVLWRELRGMLGETQSVLVQTALEQFIKFRRGDPDLLLELRPLLDHPQPLFRALAAELSGQIVDRHVARQPIPEEDSLRSALVAKARRDPAVPVRVAATEALGAFENEAVERVLREIAESDPEQEVRYRAEVLLLEKRRGETVRARD